MLYTHNRSSFYTFIALLLLGFWARPALAQNQIDWRIYLYCASEKPYGSIEAYFNLEAENPADSLLVIHTYGDMENTTGRLKQRHKSYFLQFGEYVLKIPDEHRGTSTLYEHATTTELDTLSCTVLGSARYAPPPDEIESTLAR